MQDYSVRPHPPGWAAVIDAQNAGYPKCRHGTYTAFIVNDQPICMACVEEDPTIRMWLKSGSLVSGGIT